MFNGIHNYFNKRAEKKAERKLFQQNVQQLLAAIANKDGASSLSAYEEVTSSPLFVPSLRGKLLRAAIAADNEPALSRMLADLKDPNYRFDTFQATGPGGPVFSSVEHILHAAIDAGSHDIALALARNENIDFNHSGYSETTVFGTKGTTHRTNYAPCLELAKEKGMHDVAAVLARRQARAYAAEARAESRKAAQQKPQL